MGVRQGTDGLVTSSFIYGVGPHAEQERDPNSMPSSVAKSLIENVVNTSDNPEYAEGVVTSAVGAMYLGMSILWVAVSYNISF